MAIVLGRKPGGSGGGGGGAPSGPAGGDLGGTYPNPTLSVAKEAELDGKVDKALYDANTVLAANTDDTPAAITMGASTVLARLAAGNIKAASVAEMQTLLGIGGGGGTTSVPVDLHTPRTSTLAGNSFWQVLALTDYDAGHWEFVLDVEGKVYGQVQVPADYASGGVLRLAIAANATSGVTRLIVGSKAVADAESLNPGSFTDETAQDITVPGTAYLRKDVTFTLTETLAARDLLLVEIFHDGDHANDTLAVNTLLFGAWLEYTTSF